MAKTEVLVLGLCGQSVFLSVDHFHQPEETLHAGGFFAEPGGKGYNQAVAAARLGAKVVFSGAVGRDEDGKACHDRLIREKIKSRLVEKENCHTAYACILTDRNGENRVTVYPGASLLLTAEDVERLSDDFERAAYVLLNTEIPEEAFAKAMDMGEKSGARIIVNPAPWQDWVKPYLSRAWCVTPNRSEARGMLGLAADAPLENFLKDCPCGRAVITLGSEGALCLENQKVTHLPAVKVQPVDTTGAGDTLNGALCAGLLAGKNLLEAAAFGIQAAAKAISQPHVLDGMPFLSEMQ